MDHPSGFEPTEEAAGKRFRARVLNSSIPPSKVLCPWLDQGASEDCFFLAPQQLKYSSASPYQLVNSGLRAASLKVSALDSLASSVPLSSRPPSVPPSSIALPSADTICDGRSTDTGVDESSSTPVSVDLPLIKSPSGILLSGRSTINPGTESPEAFFARALENCKEKDEKVKRLVSVVRGFPTAENFSDGLRQRLSRWSCFFQSKPGAESEAIEFEVGVARRLRQLKHAHHQIKKKNWGDTRLWLVFVAHEVEYISRWEHIDRYTSKGVGARSAAINMATKYLDTASGDIRRGRNMIQVMKTGGPAALLLDGGLPQSIWEKFLTLHDITYIFAYKRDNLLDLEERTRSHNSEVSDAIVDNFEQYGWSISRLLDSKTQVMKILKPYLQAKRPHVSDGSGDSERQNKRRRVQSEASASLPDHDFQANSSDLGSNGLDQATSISSSNTTELTSGSNSSRLISSDTRNETRSLTDATTMGHLDYTFNSSDELTDTATESILGYTVNSHDEFTDPTTAHFLGYTVNSHDEFTDPATASSLCYPISTDLDTADFF